MAYLTLAQLILQDTFAKWWNRFLFKTGQLPRLKDLVHPNLHGNEFLVKNCGNPDYRNCHGKLLI